MWLVQCEAAGGSGGGGEADAVDVLLLSIDGGAWRLDDVIMHVAHTVSVSLETNVMYRWRVGGVDIYIERTPYRCILTNTRRLFRINECHSVCRSYVIMLHQKKGVTGGRLTTKECRGVPVN